MARFTSAKALAAHQKRRFQHVADKAARLHSEMVRELVDEAEKLTSGKTKTKELRRLGHPFGRKAGWKSTYNPHTGKWRTTGGRKRGKLPTMPINRQTGTLQDGFIIRRRPKQGKGQEWSFRNKAPYAKHILSPGGTVKMVTRPFKRDMNVIWRKKNKALIEKIRKLPRDIT
ncbi:MAG: hypothetical protein EOP06_00505 [Proteobacteria bacterium]|nr:MAG: hypothetical protein EOP06_00505 [Pseudomonadota bacterium]